MSKRKTTRASKPPEQKPCAEYGSMETVVTIDDVSYCSEQCAMLHVLSEVFVRDKTVLLDLLPVEDRLRRQEAALGSLKIERRFAGKED